MMGLIAALVALIVWYVGSYILIAWFAKKAARKNLPDEPGTAKRP